MLTNKLDSFGRLLTDNDTSWLLQHRTQQSTYSSRTGTNDKDRILFRNLRNASCPKACCKNITNEQRLFITNGIRYTVQTLIGIWNPDIFRLPTVNTASQCPSPIGISTIINISVPAKKTFSTKSFNIYCHPISGPNRNNSGTDFFHNAYHLMTDRNSRYGTRHTAMFDMQIAGTNTTKRYTYNRIPCILYFRSRLLQ